MDICVLASGSGGNATFVRSGRTSVMIDAGLSLKELARRMEASGITPGSVDAVLVTHGHSDHTNGVAVLARRLGCAVYANAATAREAPSLAGAPAGLSHRFTTGGSFEVGGLRVRSFPVPHDAGDTVGFVLEDGAVRAAFATDLGSVTLDVVDALSCCQVVVLESNHDETMLLEGPYPEMLKKRVRGPLGHLSNEDAAGLLSGVSHGDLRHVVLAHLSRTNNIPDLPLEAAREALGGASGRVAVSLGWQDRPGELITIG